MARLVIAARMAHTLQLLQVWHTMSDYYQYASNGNTSEYYPYGTLIIAIGTQHTILAKPPAELTTPPRAR